MGTKLSLKDLIDIQGASRTIRAYAFLDVSLKVGENSANPTRDALDCFLPFVGAALGEQKGEQLDLQQLQQWLRAQFGFDVPLYVLDQLTGPLADRGYLKYDKTISAYLCVGDSLDFLKDQKEVLESFDELEGSLTTFAAEIGLAKPPHSSTWLDALVAFLKGLPEDGGHKVVPIKDVLTAQGPQVENYVIGRFIENAHKHDKSIFSAILSVFKGVLIEDFIAGGVHASLVDKVNDLTVFYDTALLLRLLGCSGKLLGDATLELHRYLQDIGGATQFLHVTEGEVDNIINTLVGVKDFGGNIYGETGEAIERGEYTVAALRLLKGTFVERLAGLNIFESKYSINNIHNAANYQIDEQKFEAFLKSESDKRNASYGAENRRNDAQVLGSVVVFRRGHKSRDALRSKFLFVTNNKLLAISSRKYLSSEGHYKWIDCPPILHVGQLTTIMWLLRRKGLEDKLVTRDLLANCYAAYRPDPEWLDKFLEAVANAKTLAEQGGEKVLDDSVVLQAARRIAQDQSFGRAAILQKLNVAEILARAEREREELAARHAKLGQQRGVREARKEFAERQRDRSDRLAGTVVWSIEVVVIAIALVSVVGAVWPGDGVLPGWITFVGLLVSIVSALDLFGVKIVRPTFDVVRRVVGGWIFRFLHGSDQGNDVSGP